MNRSLAMLVLAGCTGAPSAPPPALDSPPPALPADAEAVGSYTLRFPAPETQYVEVEAVFPETGDQLDLFMAKWTPGSYVLRDYARHVEAVSATTAGGQALPLSKTATNRWRVEASGVDDVVVRYKVYAADLSVQNNWVDPTFAMLNGAPTYLARVGADAGPFDVRIQRPDAWIRVSTALTPHPSGEDHRFRAADFDELVDSPILLGDSAIYTFVVDDVPHRLVNQGEQGLWDGARAAADTERITGTIADFWGGIPYRDYVFLNVIAETRGGLEHERSTLMLTNRWATHTRAGYLRWLGLVSHEFFHTWNVKRMRPASLGPFDYEHTVATESLWISEGLTSYYDDVMLVRAGLMTEDEYLERMSKNVRTVQDQPGRFERSLEDAGRDAWIKHYKKDANHDNVSVSYYVKGAVVGWLLDAEIRNASGGWASLDDAMRLAYSRHSGEAGFTPEQFQAACEEVAGVELDAFFDDHVRGTAELDYTTALEVFALRFDDPPEPEGDDPSGGWLGVSTRGGEGRRRVASIRRDGPAFEADLIVGDEIIAVDNVRLEESLDARLGRMEPGDEVALLLSRRGQLRTTAIVLADKPVPNRYTLKTHDRATIEARDTRKRWLFGATGAVEAPTASTAAPAPETAAP